jgi:acyl carrier protein
MNDEERRARIAEREAVLDRLRELLRGTLHVDRAADEIDPDTPLFGSGLRLDSIDAVDLWIGVCDAFGFPPPDDHRRITAMRTLNTLAELVLALRPGGGR